MRVAAYGSWPIGASAALPQRYCRRFLRRAPRGATVTATTPARLWSLSRAGLVAILRAAPLVGDRLRAIMLPGAIMLPQRGQTQGESRMMSVDSCINWIDAGWKPVIGTPNDRGFYERQTNLVVDQYGDIANAFTTYEKGPYTPRAVNGRGINAVQLVRRDGRWWILSITWDEENSAGPLPEKYRGR